MPYREAVDITPALLRQDASYFKEAQRYLEYWSTGVLGGLERYRRVERRFPITPLLHRSNTPDLLVF
jgi:hypothetical protein